MKKVYICASLKPENYAHVTALLKQLPEAIYLRPHMDELTAIKKLDTVESDVALMNYADEIWVLGRIGRDCSWEIGYAAGINKPVKILVDNKNESTIEDDWMLLHGTTTGRVTIHKSIAEFRKGHFND